MKQIISLGIGLGIAVPMMLLVGTKPVISSVILALIGLFFAFAINIFRD